MRLYLRLNGFFVTPLIVHSSEFGKTKTELDAVGIRMPFHAQPDRQVGFDPLLELIEPKIEVVLCEVKSRGEKGHFNPALTDNLSALQYVLRWVGAFSAQELDEVSISLQKQLKLPQKKPPTVVLERGVRVRCLIFKPETDRRYDGRPFFICGGDLLPYIHSCLVPEATRNTCATTYDLTSWGRDEPIVKYVKSLKTGNLGRMKDMYKQLLGKLDGK